MKKWLRRLFKKGGWNRFVRRIKRRKKRYILISFSIAIFILALYLLLMMNKVSESRVAFLALKNSFKNSYPCHESCLINRNKLRTQVVNNWNEDVKIRGDWLKYWENSILKKDYNLQKELLIIATQVYKNDYFDQLLVDNLLNDKIDEMTKVNIINPYLIFFNDVNLSTYYFSLISNSGENLQSAAIRALSSLSDKKRALKVEGLFVIRDLLLNEKISSNIKLDLIFLLFDYEVIFPEKVNDIFSDIYESSDNVAIKYITADHLIKLGRSGISLPEITREEWDSYFSY